jgi:PAS domain-containing protein
MAVAQEPQRVSAAEFIRGFANWRMQSARKPVVVTHHGKDAHVLISLDDYRRLDGDAASEIAAASDVRQASLAGLVDSFRDGVILIDRQRRIVALNPAASDMLEIPAAHLIGEEVTTALPGFEDSLISHHLVRLLDCRERFSGDIPGIFRPRQWLHVDLVPLPVGGAIVIRDVSEAMEGLAAGDKRQAMLDAIEIDGSIGHARISVRETIEAANAMLTGLLGVDAAAVRRVRFSALLAVGERARFVEALEAVFRSGHPVRVASQMVTRDGSVVDVTLSIVEIRGPYASDGAVVLVTRRAE